MSGFLAKSSTVTILSTATEVQVPFNQEIFDTSSYYNPGSSLASAPSDGIYQTSFGVLFEQNSIPSSRYTCHAYLRINGAHFLDVPLGYNNNDPMTVTATLPLSLKKGDQVSITYRPDSSVTAYIVILLPGCWFGMTAA